VYSVIEDSLVSLAVDDAKLRWSDDAWDTVVWVLGRDPTLGIPITESGNSRSFTVEGARSIDLPTITVVYELTPTAVVVRDAKFEDAKSARTGKA
jgi:hypothetical protein